MYNLCINQGELIMDTATFNKRIKRVVITEEEIRAKIKEVGKQLSKEYDGKPLLVVSILKGAFVFMADMTRELSVPHEIDFMIASSYYEGTVSSGVVNIKLDLAHTDISNFHVLILEDIVDTGRTLKDVVHLLKGRKPLSIKVVTLLDKPDRRLVEFNPDISLFTIPDYFVIGYGLDCGEFFRNPT